MVFKPRLYNVLCRTFYTEILDYAANIKYLGFTFSSDKKDDYDMLRRMRILYTKANRLLRLFHCCSTDVKLDLFRSYCACFYCHFLWIHYKSTHSKLRVAFNNVHHRILKLPPMSSASTMYADNHILCCVCFVIIWYVKLCLCHYCFFSFLNVYNKHIKHIMIVLRF